MKTETNAPLTFAEVLWTSLNSRGLVEQFDRLRGTHLSDAGTGSGIEVQIDLATGRYEVDMALFVEFVYDCVWTRLDPALRAVPSGEPDRGDPSA